MITENNEIVKIKISDISYNNFNPNRMPSVSFKKLLSSIKVVGLLNPIIVRATRGKFEVVDGEHRVKAYKELGHIDIPAKVIEASDDEVKAVIFASCIKGKHDSNDSLALIKELNEGGDAQLMEACNLDKNKLKRLTKYSGINKSKSTKNFRDEIDTDSVKPMEDYRPVFVCTFTPVEYSKVIKGLEEISKNHSDAIIRLLDERKVYLESTKIS